MPKRGALAFMRAPQIVCLNTGTVAFFRKYSCAVDQPLPLRAFFSFGPTTTLQAAGNDSGSAASHESQVQLSPQALTRPDAA